MAVRLGYEGRLHMLAFDHRASFQKDLFGIAGTPDDQQDADIADSKMTILDGLQLAVAQGVSKQEAAVLVDERFGAAVARRAKRDGYPLAMPVEKSGQDQFDFEYGSSFGAHIEEFDPDFAKVLVRYNPDGDPSANRSQLARLSELSGWLRDRRRKFLFELLVPPTAAQLQRVGGDRHVYDAEIRPSLVMRTMADAQAAAVEPDIWKIEGLDRREDCARVAAQARAGGRDGVACMVLGRGESQDRVVAWLQRAAGVTGFVGFAIGRTIWFEALKSWLDGEIDRDQAVVLIAENYRRMADAYSAAENREVQHHE
jgi:myo-inositol catabolism protein IolC